MQESIHKCDREETLSDSVHQQLKTDITHWKYRPGDRLKEKSIAERFGVSRTPIREALRRLEQENLLVHAPQHGYSTRALDLEELNELYQVRIALEELGAALAAQSGLDGNARSILEDLCKFWREPEADIFESGDPNMVYVDESFHERLALAGGNRYLHGSLKALNERIRIIRITDFGSAERIEVTYKQHQEILKAVMEGDVGKARLRMREHIVESQSHVSANALRALARLHEIDIGSIDNWRS